MASVEKHTASPRLLHNRHYSFLTEGQNYTAVGFEATPKPLNMS